MAKTKAQRLQVANAKAEDSGRGFARLSRETMADLGLQQGDVIEIGGKRATVARAVDPYPEDEGLNVIRLDGLQRANAGVGAGDQVELKKAESQPAKKIVFAPAQHGIRLEGPADALKRNFIGRAVVTGTLSPPTASNASSRKTCRRNCGRCWRHLPLRLPKSNSP
jgi:transitional endoplasmic reticulum ATPase